MTEITNKNGLTVAIHTLGCRVNQEDSQAMLSELLQSGYTQVAFTEKADIYIINTCTVTHLADRKSRQVIRKAVKTNPEALVVVTGCFAQTHSEEAAAIAGVGLVLGVEEKAHLVKLLASRLSGQDIAVQVSDLEAVDTFTPISQEIGSGDRTRGFLKIQDGCENFCTYCIVPYARGKVRSLPRKQAVAFAEKMVAAGYSEIVLSGIHIGAYGKDLAAGENLARLVGDIAEIPGLARLRLGSIEPMEVTTELLAVVRDHANICRHFHIPLQAGCDKTLAAMGRDYTTADYAKVITCMKELFPDVAVTTDVIVGFPGETEEDFQAGYDFIAEMGFSKIHIFPYSIRPGTPAAEYPEQVDSAVKKKRCDTLEQLAKKLTERTMSAYIGKEVTVLLEQPCRVAGKDYWQGYTEHYLPALVEGSNEEKGKIIKVLVKFVQNGIMYGDSIKGR